MSTAADDARAVAVRLAAEIGPHRAARQLGVKPATMRVWIHRDAVRRAELERAAASAEADARRRAELVERARAAAEAIGAGRPTKAQVRQLLDAVQDLAAAGIDADVELPDDEPVVDELAARREPPPPPQHRRRRPIVDSDDPGFREFRPGSATLGDAIDSYLGRPGGGWP